MADVSHELGALRFVVDSPLSSKVAMFNNQANQHKQSQLLNPFSNSDGRVSPKPQFSKDEYGKPLAGSLTEMRGQKANIHVMKEMLELCQIIDSEGYTVKDEPKMRVIPFGELFNIYNYISDKVVGILLRARKHKLVEFEGEMLFQRRDDDVPIFLLMPIAEIRSQLESKMEEIKRASSPAPQATSVLLDKSAHLKKLRDQELGLPKSGRLRSRTPSPSPAGSTVVSQASTPAGSTVPSRAATPPAIAQLPVFIDKITAPKLEAAVVKAIKPEQVTPDITIDAPPKDTAQTEPTSLATESGSTVATTEKPTLQDVDNTPTTTEEVTLQAAKEIPPTIATTNRVTPVTEPTPSKVVAEVVPAPVPAAEGVTAKPTAEADPAPVPTTAAAETLAKPAVKESTSDATIAPDQPTNLTKTSDITSPSIDEKKIDVANKDNNTIIPVDANDDVPITEVIEATAVYVRSVSIDASKTIDSALVTSPTVDVAPTSPSGDNQNL